jgi:peptide deformylase
VSVDLLDTMGAQQLCVGLAANQIDSPLSVAVVSRSGTEEEPLILFNPVVLSATGKKDKKRESCMSVWGFTGEVERRSNIVVAFEDYQLQPMELMLSGFVARVAAHEIDHLQGVTFVDHVAGGLVPTDLFDGFSPGVP